MNEVTRHRMYLFERAYVDYVSWLRRFSARLWRLCQDVWYWFWQGGGATAIEWILRLVVAATAVGLTILYIRYELDHGRSYSFSMAGNVLVIAVFAFMILWGWKAVVHFVARITSGLLASGVILCFTALALLAAILVFVPYLLALLALTLLSFAAFVPMRLAHSFWLLRRRITYRCPYDDCSYSGLPIHLCPAGHRYDDLQPSFYGIFYHICQHADGAKVRLPTMDFLGRNKLERLCGSCQRPLIFSTIGELAEQPVAIIGGPGAGKTIFIRQAVRQLQVEIKTMPNGVFQIEAAAQRQQVENDLRLLDKGQVLAKTAGDVMQALGITIRISRKQQFLLYLFDAPGEHFLAMDQFARKQVLQHMKGIILLVDPFSLPALMESDGRFDFSPAAFSFHRIVEVLIAGVNQMILARPTDQCAIPLAIVLSKADALPVKEYPFLQELCPNGQFSRDNGRIRQALNDLGGNRSIHALERKFTNIHYFVATALGRPPDHLDVTPFRPVGVTDPFLWLLGAGMVEELSGPDQARLKESTS